MAHIDPICSWSGMHATDLATYVVKPQISPCLREETCMMLLKATQYHSRCCA
jgi:hypothetical protein